MGTTKSENAPSPSLAAWQARSVHTVTVWSGQRLKIRIPGIATLLEQGDLPDDLLELALMELTSEGGATAVLAAELSNANGNKEQTLERLRKYGAFQRHLVCAAIVAVEGKPGKWQDVTLSLDDLAEFPEDDLAMVAEFVQRLRSHDARGVRIGVEPLDRWATFRQSHGCPDEDCPGCKKLIEQLSSVDVGAV